MAAVAALAARGLISKEEEDGAVDAVVTLDPGVALLARHYADSDPLRFARHAARNAAVARASARKRLRMVGSAV